MDLRVKQKLEKCFYEPPQPATSIGIESLMDFELGAIAENEFALNNIAPTVNGEMLTYKELSPLELGPYTFSYLIQSVENQLCPFVAELPSCNGSRFLLYTVQRWREPIFDTQILDAVINILNPGNYEPLFRDIYYTHHLFSLVWATQGWVELPSVNSLPQFLTTESLKVHALVRDILPNFLTFTDTRAVQVYVNNTAV